MSEIARQLGFADGEPGKPHRAPPFDVRGAQLEVSWAFLGPTPALKCLVADLSTGGQFDLTQADFAYFHLFCATHFSRSRTKA